ERDAGSSARRRVGRRVPEEWPFPKSWQITAGRQRAYSAGIYRKMESSPIFVSLRRQPAIQRRLNAIHMQNWKDYQDKNKDRFLNELLALLRIPSVSARSEHKGDMQKCAEAVRASLVQAGVDKADI